MLDSRLSSRVNGLYSMYEVLKVEIQKRIEEIKSRAVVFKDELQRKLSEYIEREISKIREKLDDLVSLAKQYWWATRKMVSSIIQDYLDEFGTFDKLEFCKEALEKAAWENRYEILQRLDPGLHVELGRMVMSNFWVSEAVCKVAHAHENVQTSLHGGISRAQENLQVAFH